jgi:hypothetical protein
MRLPMLTTGVHYDRLKADAAAAAVQPSTDWWACARCAAKVPGCYAVCQVDPSGVGCAACITSGGDDCLNCFQ